jgi:hypothetical protein
MAYRSKRRSSTKRRSSGRRRIGGVKARRESVTRVIGLVGGAIGTGLINKYAGAKLNPKILGAIEVVAGYFLPTFIKGDLASGIGDGLIAGGGFTLAREFNLISGIPIIAGWKELGTVNGTPRTPDQRRVMEASVEGGFRPSVSQVFNGMYYRRPMD